MLTKDRLGRSGCEYLGQNSVTRFALTEPFEGPKLAFVCLRRNFDPSPGFRRESRAFATPRHEMLWSASNIYPKVVYLSTIGRPSNR